MSPEPGENRKVTKNRLLEIFRESDKPILTTGEIISQVPVTRPAVNPRLEELIDEGELGARKASNTWFYWLPGRVVEKPSERIVGDELVLDVDDRHRDKLENIAEEENITPEEAASEVLANALKRDPYPYWDTVRTISFGVVVWFFVYTAAITYAPDILVTAIRILGAAFLVAFAIAFIMMGLHPIVEPQVNQALNWWEEHRAE